jgi:hypothetical protein
LQVSIPQHEGVNFLQFGYDGVAVIHSFISLMYYASKITSPSTTLLLNFQSYLSKAATVLQGKRPIRMNRALRLLNAMILCTHSLKIRI